MMRVQQLDPDWRPPRTLIDPENVERRNERYESDIREADARYAEANRAFWRQTVLPLVARVQKSFQAWLQPGFGSFRLDYNADRLRHWRHS